MFDSKALGKRTVYSCFSIKQQSEVGAVARVAQVPAVGPVGAAACCPHLCNGDHGQWGGQNHSFTAGQNRFFAERKT